MKIMDLFKKKKSSLPKPTPKEALEGLKIVYETIQENHRVTEEQKTRREEIQALKVVEIEKIRSQREVLQQYFNNVFEERRNNFNELFKRLDKGIEDGNLELMQISLGAIIEIAKDSPLKEIKKLREDFYNNNIKEIEI